MSNTNRNTQTFEHTSIRWTVKQGVLLSIATLPNGTQAVGLWKEGHIERESAVEIRRFDRAGRFDYDLSSYAATDYAAELVKKELGGSMPPRFFRDFVLEVEDWHAFTYAPQ